MSPECIRGDAVKLTGGVARQLARVLRSRPGDRIAVLDDSGLEYLVALESVRPTEVRGVVTGSHASSGEPRVRITLYQGVLKGDRFEFVLQKGTELGISAFVPILCARTVPRERGTPWASNRYVRWRRIITEAAEQSQRGRIPVLQGAVEFPSACDGVEGPALIPWEGEGVTGLKQALASWRRDGGDEGSISVFIGPEGGFMAEEVDYARARSIVPVSLGRRILRSETAGLAVASAILYELGELGG